MRHDFLLLVDLHDLARNLDRLDRDLTNAATAKAVGHPWFSC